ncbi:uncharacterized protein LOC117547418 [Gymnodraco acuticeps]|uniref:Uncharacterized protein LOC117547418 n=1 Tax=Gymnodraco acuticeps TaxID=8218 RepID=A0A6P8UB14_GYMAC|nr:uncharacterized protein LOC117547418 [Gymnodraco acuticeps]
MPSVEKENNLWLDFIFKGHVPEDHGRFLFVCSKHFTTDMFMNFSQVQHGYASKLMLNPGSIPTIREQASEDTSNFEAASTSHATSRLPVMTDSACQTDPPKYRTVRTQLSSRTLGSHRSTAVQAKIPCRSVGVETLPLEVPVPFLTSTPLKRPPKRPRVDLEEEYEDPFEGSSSLVFSEGQDATYDPAESITNATETTAMSGQEQNPPPDDQHIHRV